MRDGLSNVKKISGIRVRTPDYLVEVAVGSFVVTVKEISGVLFARLSGRIVASSHDGETDAIAGLDLLFQQLRRLGNGCIALNLSKVIDLDMAAVRHLVDAKVWLQKELGGELVVVGVPGGPLLLAAKLVTVLTALPSEPAAIAYFGLERRVA
jgi:hypothetical protein